MILVFLFYVREYFAACMKVYHVHDVPLEARRGSQIPRNWR